MEIYRRGITRGRKGLGLHHWLLVHQGEAAGSSAASLVGWRGELEDSWEWEGGKWREDTKDRVHLLSPGPVRDKDKDRLNHERKIKIGLITREG